MSKAAKTKKSAKKTKPLRVSVHGDSIDLELRLDTSASTEDFEGLLRKISQALPKGTPPVVEGPPGVTDHETLVALVGFVTANARPLPNDMIDVVIDALNGVKADRASPSTP